MAKKKRQSSNQLEIQNAAKTLFANIRFMSVDDPIRSLVVTSSVPNEGKSTVSMNLGQAIATSGKRVLIVEADMRRRSMATMLNVRAANGIYAVLTEAVTLEEAVVETATPDLFFLDTEPNIPNPADIISSKRFKRFVHQLEENYDYVIFDMPPVGTFVDAAILSTLVDGTIMVVRPNFTKRTELTEAFEQLQKADANVIGLCATFVEGSGSEYYYAYYTSDGERVKEEGSSDPVPLPDKLHSALPRTAPKGNSRAAMAKHQAYRTQQKHAGRDEAPLVSSSRKTGR